MTEDSPWQSIVWGTPQWQWPVAAAVVLLSSLVIWNYLARRPLHWSGGLAALLKLVAIALTALCVLQPLRRGTRPRPRANVFPILVDTSQSMQITTRPGGPARVEQVQQWLSRDAAWQARLAQDFDVRLYTFDSRVQNVDSFDQIEAKGYASSLTTSLRSLSTRFGGRPVAGVLLLTDGNLTDRDSQDGSWSELGFPVYPVQLDSGEAMPDVRVEDISITQTDFESAPTTVNVTLQSEGLAKSAIDVELVDVTAAKSVAKQSVSLDPDGIGAPVRFRFRPERSGASFYRVTARLAGDSEPDAIEDPMTDSSLETTTANNSRLLAVNRRRGPYRVLYVAGRPNWEYKFIRRSLQSDPEVQMVGLLRIAKEEPKFSFRDRGVNSTNPLFAGLGEDDEEAAEQYDEPVILRLGVKESEELSDGFPDTAEELFGYHGLILDDLENDFFSEDQLLMIRRFVARRGGGLLLLGGQEGFDPDSFADSPLGELSPVYARRRDGQSIQTPVRFQLSREGMLQPWMRLRDTEDAERKRLADLTPLTTVNAVGEIKPGASVLATVTTRDGEVFPAITSQRFGKGRTAAIVLGDVWRWAMHRDEDNSDDPAKSWRQITHWLVNEVPRRAEVRIQRDPDPSQPTQIVVTARDEAYLPLDNATVDVEIRSLGGLADEVPALKLVAQPDPEQAGMYVCRHWSGDPGGFLATAKISGPDGSVVGNDSAGWTTQPQSAEFQRLASDEATLEELAKQSGGEVLQGDRLDEFVQSLPSRKLPVTETWVYPIWHTPWVMLAALACLCGEWGLRRWKGMA